MLPLAGTLVVLGAVPTTDAAAQHARPSGVGAPVVHVTRASTSGARAPVAGQDTLPVVTLDEAVARATRVDPAAVAARGQVDNAEWARRAASAALLIPSVSVGADATTFSAPAFNVGTLQPATQIATAQVQASYDLFLGGRQLANVRRASTAVAGAEARAVEVRFGTALATTADYYAVVAGRELARVAADRVRRAEEQLAVARARVVSGAVVQTDSLQLLLELTRARQERLEQDAALRVAQLQLGRRVGIAGPVNAATADTMPAPPLPLTVEEAIARATANGPAYVAARTEEEAADAALRAERSAYLPRVTLSAAAGSFDRQIFPDATYRSQFGVGVSLPLWDNGAREVAISQARVGRDVAAARRRDLERGAAQAVTAAYTNFTTARAGVELATVGVDVARETYRVQDVRYRSGATTILDVLEAQGALTRAEADLVQARRRVHLALAELEAILGSRLFSNGDVR